MTNVRLVYPSHLRVSSEPIRQPDARSCTSPGVDYLRVTDADFEKATHFPTRVPAEMFENDRKRVVRTLHENEKAPEFPGLSWPFSSVNFMAVPPTGVEPSQETPGNSTVVDESDSHSDSRLARLIEVWPALLDDVKAEILSLAGLRPDDVDDFNDVTANCHGNGVS